MLFAFRRGRGALLISVNRKRVSPLSPSAPAYAPLPVFLPDKVGIDAANVHFALSRVAKME